VRLLFDTHAFLWFMSGDARLPARARRAIEREAVAVVLSAASVWEMAIKASLGRLTMPTTAAEYTRIKRELGLEMLTVDWAHAAAVEVLPLHHRDPFDRLLIAQAQIEGLAIVTGDPAFRNYHVQLVW
jgi:PIN domain nuclease of toxin-antitoxin system